MKALSDSEKMELLRYHGERLSRAFLGIHTRDEMIDHAQRAIEIIKSIPKIQFPDR
jgi:hypothetical protein